MSRRRPLALLALLLACGPKLPGDTDALDTTTTSPSTTTTTAGGSTTGAVDPTTTSSTGAATTEGTTAASTSEGCSFLGCGTGGPQCAVVDGKLRCSACDVWTQDCPEGQKCAPWANDGGSAWNTTKCVDVVDNPGKPGDECTVEGSGVSGVDSCDKAALCWNVDDETMKGTCVGFCTGSQEAPLCEQPGTTCVIANDGVLILCLPSCDPLQQDCPGTDLCISQPMGDGFVCVLDASGEQGQQNNPCEFANACDPGLVCLDPSLATECDPMAIGCCLPFCDVTAPDCTNQGAECIPWFEMGMAPPGLENIGVCGLPQ